MTEQMKKEVEIMLGLVPYRRRGGFPDVFKEMEELTREFLPEVAWHDIITGGEMEWAPRLDIIETEKNVEVKAELPGLERKDIDITLDRDLLVIKGEKKEEKEEKDRYYHRVERRYGTFCRSVRLPAKVKDEKIDATFKDGILTITLPKVETEVKKVTHIDVH
jgi:HSP20 family protein